MLHSSFNLSNFDKLLNKTKFRRILIIFLDVRQIYINFIMIMYIWSTFCGLGQLKPIIVFVYMISLIKERGRTYVRTDTFRANIPKLRCRSPTLVLYFLCTCTKRIKTILPFGPFGPKWQDTGKNYHTYSRKMKIFNLKLQGI